MINNHNTHTEQEQVDNNDPKKQTVPDEQPGIAVQGFLKIHDPESGEVLVQSRV